MRGHGQDLLALNPPRGLDGGGVHELGVVEADAATIEPARRVEGEQILAVAAHVGPARLIDNLRIVTRGSEVETDLGVVVEEQLA